MKTKLYAEISKIEPQEDGTLKVYGYASSESVDGEGEIISAEAMKAALPDYMKFGAVREMHQPIAAGTAIEARVEEDGRTWFGAHVVDPTAVKKVETKVYKGFSIGGKIQERDKINKNMITQLKLIEVSLVDRPCNPDAIFVLQKFETDETPTVDVHATPDEIKATEELAEILNKGDVAASKILDLIKASQIVKPKFDLKKGMYSVGCMASCLESIAYLAENCEDEAAWEGDSSPIPAMLRDWVAQGAEIFIAMSKEEAEEMIAGLRTSAGIPETLESVIEASAKLGDLKKAATFGALSAAIQNVFTEEEINKLAPEIDATKTFDELKAVYISKAGARHSKQDMDRLQAAHDHLSDMGAKCMKVETEEDAADGEKVAKAAKDDTAQLKAEIAALTERLKKVEAMPAAMPRANIRVVAKGEDLGKTEQKTGQATIELIKDSAGNVDMAATVIKAIQAQGGTPGIF